MYRRKYIFLLCVYSCVFTLCIFITRTIIFPSHYLEEKYVEPTASDVGDFQNFSSLSEQEINATVSDLITEHFHSELDHHRNARVHFHSIPESFISHVENSYISFAKSFLFHRDIFSNIEALTILVHKKQGASRGKMKSKNIYMHGITQMSGGEFLAVLIHEFGHYIDIYKLKKTAFGDESQKFYEISWESPTIMKPYMQGEDFVSGYAMTNQYEDFAESYVYYVLHNKDFFLKAQENEILAKKYSFFQHYIFQKNLFFKSDFSENEDIKSYYWDITKLQIDLKKFLQYMKEGI